MPSPFPGMNPYLLHRAYDAPRYEDFIYNGEPEPSLSANDAAWARQFVPAKA